MFKITSHQLSALEDAAIVLFRREFFTLLKPYFPRINLSANSEDVEAQIHANLLIARKWKLASRRELGMFVMLRLVFGSDLEGVVALVWGRSVPCSQGRIPIASVDELVEHVMYHLV